MEQRKTMRNSLKKHFGEFITLSSVYRKKTQQEKNVRMNISVEKTAIQNGQAQSVKEFASLILPEGDVLDYGAGKLRNAVCLQTQGYSVSVLDTELQLQRVKADAQGFTSYTPEHLPQKSFDGIICTFVLNVIPERKDRDLVLKNIFSFLTEGGIGIFEVRSARGILSNKYLEHYQDGYAVGKGNSRSFQKSFTLEELTLLLEMQGFQILTTKKYNDSVCAVVSKRSASV